MKSSNGLSKLKKAFTRQKANGTKTTQPTVTIDFPQEGEKILQGHYAVRCSSTSGDVEVSINGKEWQACRRADGYFWFDWTPEQTGPAKILARTKAGEKSWKKSRTRKCLIQSA